MATSSWTLPSHASLLTGRYPHDHGGIDDYNYRAKDFTIGEKLQSLGYRSAAISANREFFTKRWGFDRGFDHFGGLYATFEAAMHRTVFGYELAIILERLFPSRVEREDAAVTGKLASDWVAKDPQRPFFVVINFYRTHSPYHPPDIYDTVLTDAPPRFGITRADPRFHPPAVLDEARLRRRINRYDGAIRNIDDEMRRLVGQITQSNRRTIVIVTSDHGEAFGEHGTAGHKSSLYWEQIRVPIIIWAPGMVPQGVHVKTPVSIASIPATLMQLLGQQNISEFPTPGLRSYWAPMESRPAGWPISEITQYQFPGTEGSPVYFGGLASVITEKWHFIQHEKLGVELFDWQADPQEQHDLSRTPEGEVAQESLSRYLQEMLKRR